nr:hypothetical protein [Anaerolineae bacterium]
MTIVTQNHRIDTTFDFRSDTPPGKDPDAHSPTLRCYHRLLWSKPLPGGDMFNLVVTTPRVYLHHQSQAGEFFLSSDAVIPSFSREKRMSRIIQQVPAEELDAFLAIGYTIGGMMVFPANRVDRKATINGARGLHPRIKDRFDLTIECIRRYYHNQDSPLDATFDRYSDFFKLFEDFRGYVEFFLLQDLVTRDCSRVLFFTPFTGFETSPLPDSLETYGQYRQFAVEFIQARNKRISRFASTLRQR